MTIQRPESGCIVFGPGVAAGLAAGVAAGLEVPLGHCEFREFERGEHKSRALDDVEGRVVAVVAGLYGEIDAPSANDRLVQTWLFVGSLKDAGARDVTVVAPYLPYARKDRRTAPRDPLNGRYVAQLFEAAGADRLVVLEPHNLSAFENAFRIPTVPLPLAPLVADWVRLHLPEPVVTVVSPDVGGVKRAQQLRSLLTARGQRTGELAFFEKRRSRDVVTGGMLIGEVAGRTCLIVDDLIASGGTLARAARACRAQGAEAVYAAAAHALFLSDTVTNLSSAGLDRLLVTESIPVPGDSSRGLPLEVLRLAPYLAAALRCLWFGGALGDVTALGT